MYSAAHVRGKGHNPEEEVTHVPTVFPKGNCIHDAESLCIIYALLNFLRFPKDYLTLESLVFYFPHLLHHSIFFSTVWGSVAVRSSEVELISHEETNS